MKKVCVWNKECEQKGGTTCAEWPNEVPRFWYDMSPEFAYDVKVPLTSLFRQGDITSTSAHLRFVFDASQNPKQRFRAHLRN